MDPIVKVVKVYKINGENQRKRIRDKHKIQNPKENLYYKKDLKLRALFRPGNVVACCYSEYKKRMSK